MNRAQLSLAGKLWSLALVAHVDPDFDNDDERKVARNGVKRARSAMRRLGVDQAALGA